LAKTTLQARPTGYLALLAGNRNYRYLWIGEVISLFGDWFNLIASAALVSSLTQSGLAIGGLFVVRMLAPFLVSPLAGVAADRFNRKWLLILADLTRAAVVLGFLLVRDARHVWLLYTLTTIQLGISGFFYPARNALLPNIVVRKELGAANALSSATWSVMLGEWGIYPAFIIDALTFLLSAFFIAQLRYTPQVDMEAAVQSVRGALHAYVAGLRYLVKNDDILAISLHKAASALTVGGLFTVIQVVLAEQVFVIGEGGGTSLGLLFAIAGVGTGLGPIIARWFTGDREQALRVTLAWSYVITFLGLAMVAPLASFALVLLGSLVRTVGSGINWVFSTQLLLQRVPDHVRGRVFASEFAAFTLATALGSALGGWIVDHTTLSLTTLIWLMAAVSLIPGAVWALWIIAGGQAKR